MLLLFPVPVDEQSVAEVPFPVSQRCICFLSCCRSQDGKAGVLHCMCGVLPSALVLPYFVETNIIEGMDGSHGEGLEMQLSMFVSSVLVGK